LKSLGAHFGARGRMTVGYLIKENSEDADKIYYDFDDIENGNKLYREQFPPPLPSHRLIWTGTTNNLKWYEVEPPKPPKPIGWHEAFEASRKDRSEISILHLRVILCVILRLLIKLVISYIIWFGIVILTIEIICWSDPEFRRGGGIIVVIIYIPLFWMIPYLVI